MAEPLARLSGDSRYAREFRSVFHREVETDDVAFALASYVRSILSGDSPIDRYMKGERTALSDEAKHGLQVFRGKGNCTACPWAPHSPTSVSHNTGVAWRL